MESPSETSIFWLLPPLEHIIYGEARDQHTTSNLILVKQQVVQQQQLQESHLDYQNEIKNDAFVVLIVAVTLIMVITVLVVLMLLPVQTCDDIPHGVDQALVLLGAANDDAVQLLHVGVDGVQGRRLSTGCRGGQHKTGSSKPSAMSQAVPIF